MAAPKKLTVGEQAPDFACKTADGETLTLADLRGQKVILWFYPAANTSLCTKQAIDLRDNRAEFEAAGYRLIGVSPDSPEAVREFIEQQNLPFTMLADETKEMMTAYGTWGEKNSYGKIVTGTIRSTFALDEDGKIIFAKYRVGTPKHIETLRKALLFPTP
ncbi:peroxiredoxin [Dermabacteraceae bacterium P13077]